jgi:endonuclease YncB( thermonuclease family)
VDSIYIIKRQCEFRLRYANDVGSLAVQSSTPLSSPSISPDARKARLIEVDTPESGDPRDLFEHYAVEATRFHKTLAEGKAVTVECNLNGLHVNRELIWK